MLRSIYNNNAKKTSGKKKSDIKRSMLKSTEIALFLLLVCYLLYNICNIENLHHLILYNDVYVKNEVNKT